jgi:hypothetical protein
MTEIQNPQQLAFDLICNLMLAICYFRFIWDRGYLSLFQSTAAKYQGFFFAKKNANSNRNRIGVLFSAPNLLF